MAVTNEAIGGRVRNLLDGHAMTQSDLAARVLMDPTALSKSVKGERTFKPREIAAICEAFGVPVGALLEGSAPTQDALYAARRNADAQEGVGTALKRAAMYIELADLIGYQQPVREIRGETPSATTHVAGGQFAERVLAQAGLGANPLPASMHDLAALIESKLRIQVAIEPLGAGLDGLSVNCSRFGMAMVSTEIAATRQRWTLAHEVGHVLLRDAEDDLHVDESVFRRSPIETRANAFAAGLLMPRALVQEHWGQFARITEARVARMLDTFGVSLEALAFRLHNLALVNATGRDSIRRMRPMLSIIRNQGTRQSEGMWLPSGLAQAGATAYQEGRLGLRWMAAIVQLPESTLARRIEPDRDEVEAFSEKGDMIAS